MNTMNSRDSRLRAGLSAAALLLALALAGCGKGGAKDEHAGEKEGAHSEAESELTLTSEEAARAGIKVEEVKPQPLGETITVTATIRPDADRLAHVAPRIEGRITAVPAKLGDKVRAGQALAMLDSVAVGEAHAAWIEAQAELGIAEADYKRAEALNAEEIIPRKDYLRAKAARDEAAAALPAASACAEPANAPRPDSSARAAGRIILRISKLLLSSLSRAPAPPGTSGRSRHPDPTNQPNQPL